MNRMLISAPAGAVSWPAWWRVLTEFGFFVGLALVIGGTLGYLAVLRPALRDPRAALEPADARWLRTRVARRLAVVGPILLVTGYGQLAARVARADTHTSIAAAFGPARIGRFLAVPAKSGSWASFGALIAIQNVLLLVLALLLVSLFQRRAADRLDRTVALAAPLALAATVVISVPTSSGSVHELLDLLLDQLHILGACTWLGGLAGLALLAGRRLAFPSDSTPMDNSPVDTTPVDSRRSGLGWRSSVFWAVVWQRFSVLAMSAVGVIITSGCWLAWQHVSGPGELLTTHYGRFLLVKLLLVLTMVSMGGYNQFVLTPKAARAHALGDLPGGFAVTVRHFPTVVAAEAALGCGVLLIVPFLTGSARTQAGVGPPHALDGGLLAFGVLLVGCLAGSLYAAHRVAVLLVQRAGPPSVGEPAPAS